MIWTKPSTFVGLAIVYFVAVDSFGVEDTTYVLFSMFILYLFYRLITWKRN